MHDEWTISYTQGDVDTIREQIEQTESAKRHWLVLGFLIALAVLAGAIILLSTNYALYSSGQTEKKKVIEENAALKARADQTQQQLDTKTAQETKESQAREEAQSKLGKLLPAVLKGKAGGGEIANFARMVYNSPNSRMELNDKPPNDLFRNWKVTTGSTTEVYALVGGFIDGKWIVYSNLVARKSAKD
jgi:flagellar biosynthesis component FlhA